MTKKRLTILFDANAFMTKKTGVGYYTARLIEHMAAQYPDDLEFVGYYYDFLGRKQAPDNPIGPNISYRPIRFMPAPLVYLLRRCHIQLPVEFLTLLKPDFIIYPNYLGHPSLFRIPSAAIIYDLSYHDLPEYGSQKAVRDLAQFVPDSIRRSSFIITISAFSRQRIVDTYAVREDNILTTFIPFEPPAKLPDKQRTQLLAGSGISKPFLLFMGTLEPRKNITSLLEAYTLLPEGVRSSHTLVIAGKLDWKYQETKDRLEKLQSEGYDINYLGYVDETTQAALYQGASLFILPSHYEGFGMPIIEALSHGTPCAVSDIPVFHEVGGDAVRYFDHTDPDDIAFTIAGSIAQGRPDPSKLRSYLAGLPDWDAVSADVAQWIQKAAKR